MNSVPTLVSPKRELCIEALFFFLLLPVTFSFPLIGTFSLFSFFRLLTKPGYVSLMRGGSPCMCVCAAFRSKTWRIGGQVKGRLVLQCFAPDVEALEGPSTRGGNPDQESRKLPSCLLKELTVSLIMTMFANESLLFRTREHERSRSVTSISCSSSLRLPTKPNQPGSLRSTVRIPAFCSSHLKWLEEGQETTSTTWRLSTVHPVHFAIS